MPTLRMELPCNICTNYFPQLTFVCRVDISSAPGIITNLSVRHSSRTWLRPLAAKGVSLPARHQGYKSFCFSCGSGLWSLSSSLFATRLLHHETSPHHSP